MRYVTTAYAMLLAIVVYLMGGVCWLLIDAHTRLEALRSKASRDSNKPQDLL